LFVREAVQNLKSWRLEETPRQDPLRITYSYVIDASIRRELGEKLEFALPNQVTISADP
jgi:hypothetical protein